MASVTYSGSFGGYPGSEGITTTLTGSAIPSGATITSISYSLRISANKYSSSEYWNLTQMAVGGDGGSPTATSDGFVSMYGTNHTFTGNMRFSTSDVNEFSSDTITVYAEAYTTHSATSYLWEVSITVNYVEYTACGAPTSCSVNNTLAIGNVTLSWSGATAGYGNAVTGYEVQRCESTNGSNWGSWSHLTTTTASSLSVAPPATAGNYYKYRVRTLGAAGSSFYSGWKESSNTLRRGHAALDGFTDPVLVGGATYIKAVHMQELQNRVATLRSFYGLGAYKFTSIVAGQTSLAGWTAHVTEIRKAIDEIGVQHETWLPINENKPRAAVIVQLRQVILSM